MSQNIPFTVIEGLKGAKVYRNEENRGYVLSKKIRENKLYLKCKFYTQKCNGRAKLEDGLLYETTGHTCEQVAPEYWDIFHAKVEMKKRASSTADPLRNIWSDVLSQSSQEAQANVNWPGVAPSMKYQRSSLFPPIPSTVEETVYVLDNGEHPFNSFYKGWVEFGDEIGLIFAADECLDILSGAKNLFLDATFKVRPHPKLFAQVLNILIDFKGTVLPVIHIVMTSKRQGLYESIIEKLKSFGGENFAPQNSMSDFEAGLLNSIRSAFPNIQITGCRFHFGQALLRKVKETMAVEFRDDKEFATFARKHFALSLLPPDQILPVLNLLKGEISQLRSARCRRQWKILHQEYFLKYWIQQVGPDVISNYGLEHRTNNHCESLHSRMAKKIHHGVTIWSFLDQLSRHVIEPTVIEIAQIKNNLSVRMEEAKKTKFAKCVMDKAEKKLQEHIITPIQFINQMAHQFSNLKLAKSDLERIQTEKRNEDLMREQEEIEALEAEQ